jgi:spermidine/putrescine transport system ATP-binding protein
MTDTHASGALELSGLTKRYGDNTVVKGIDLTLRPGEFVSLLGPSGCGKTTTLRMIAGFESVDAGDIRLGGVSVRDTPANKRDVNTVFQSYALFPHLSVAGNIAYGLRQRKVAKSDIEDRVTDALDLVRLTPLADRRPAQLSGGQQQRVALARALVNRPQVLLLDEPLAALDRQLREQMQIELQLIQHRLNTTFLFVTHDQHEALAMSDRIAIMNDGRIEQLDAPDAVYTRPASRFVAGFVGQQNFFEGIVDTDRRFATADDTRFSLTQAPHGLMPGDPVTLAVRPEAVRLRAGEHPTDSDAIETSVVARSYLGDVVQYVLHSAARQEIIARIPRRDIDESIVVGDTVTCSWADTAVAAFPANSPTAQATTPEPALTKGN